MIHLLWASLAIPVIIHMVYRRRAKPMPFSTLYFLQQIDQKVHRRYRLKEILLLLARLALLAALVGALERPMLRSATFKGTGVPTTSAVVLDNTYSMRAVDEGSTAFARAKGAAKTLLEGLTSKDAAVLTLLDPRDATAARPTTAVGRLRARLAKMPCGYGTGELSAALAGAMDSLEKGQNERKEIYILTDMQKLVWTPAVEEQGRRLAEKYPDTPVFLIDVGTDVTENLTVSRADFGSRINVRGTSSNLYVELENTSSRNVTGKLAMFLEEEKTQEQEIGLAGGAKRTAVFQHVFEQKGHFAGRVELEPDDLPADNRRYFTVEVHEQVPVLVINGDPSVIPYRDGAFFLRLALQGKAPGGRRLSPIDPKVITPRQLQSVRLPDFACVVLANVSRIGDRMAQNLSAYVRGGGGLLVFLGDNVDAPSYNMMIGASAGSTTRKLSADAEETTVTEEGGIQLLPGNLGRVVKPDRESGFFHMRNVNPRHPIFRDILSELNLKNAQIKRFFALDQPRGEPGEGVTLIALANGPLLVEKTVGGGTVVLCTTSATPDWNNMPLKPFFLPILHQIVYYVGGPAAREVSTPVGMSYRLKIPDTNDPVRVEFHPPPTEQQIAEGKTPEPVTINSEMRQGTNSAVFDRTGRPGIYRADIHLGQKVRTRTFAVNVPTKESDLDRLPLQEAKKRLGIENLIIVQEAERLSEIVRREREGLPLWDYLLMLCIGIAVAETYISNVLLKHGGEEE